MRSNESLTCNCFHERSDHRQREIGFFMWCLFSEYGQCPCDCYTPMDNLEWLEWKSGI